MLRVQLALTVGAGLFASACSYTASSSGGAGGGAPEDTSVASSTAAGVGGGVGASGPGGGGSASVTTSAGVGGAPSSVDCWGRRIGLGQGIEVAADHAGNMIVYGSGGADFGGGPSAKGGIYLAKLSPEGTLLWSVELGGGSYALEVEVDSADNLLLGGVFSGVIDFGGGPQAVDLLSGFLAKFDPTGNLLWSKVFAGPDLQIVQLPIGIDAAGNIAVGGSFNGTVDLGGGPVVAPSSSASFIARFDAAGNFLWNKAFAGSSAIGGVAFDPLGNLLVSGNFGYEVDLGGGPLDPAEGWTFLAKYDAAGGHIWSRNFGDYLSVTAWQSIESDAAGNVVWGIPSMSGKVDFGGGELEGTKVDNTAIAKFDPNGKYLWAHVYEGVFMGDLALDPTGAVVFSGAYQGSVDFGGGPLQYNDKFYPFLAKLSASGSHVASQWSNSLDMARAYDVALDPAGRVFWSGALWSSVNLPCGAITAPEHPDGYLFVAKQVF